MPKQKKPPGRKNVVTYVMAKSALATAETQVDDGLDPEIVSDVVVRAIGPGSVVRFHILHTETEGVIASTDDEHPSGVTEADSPVALGLAPGTKMNEIAWSLTMKGESV